MIEQFHQLYKCKFCIIAVHIIDLPTKGLSKRMTAKVLIFNLYFSSPL